MDPAGAVRTQDLRHRRYPNQNWGVRSGQGDQLVWRQQSHPQPSFEYGGVAGKTEYFVTSRGLWNTLGLENPTPSTSAIHDTTEQGKAFGYTSTLIDANTRVSSLAGYSVQRYQIPNNPGQSPAFTPYGVSDIDSSQLNQNQIERSFFGVVAPQKKLGDLDYQISAFTRNRNLHFKPDPIGDLVFNGVASDVNRTSFLGGIQGDRSYRLNSGGRRRDRNAAIC